MYLNVIVSTVTAKHLRTIVAFAGVDYKHICYSTYMGIHEFTVSPTQNDSAT